MTKAWQRWNPDAARKAIAPLVEEAVALKDRLGGTPAYGTGSDTRYSLHGYLIDAIADANDEARLRALIVQAKIALGDLPPIEHHPQVMLTEEEVRYREEHKDLLPRVEALFERRSPKPPRTFDCTKCGQPVVYTRLRCDCGTKLIVDPAVRELVLAARTAVSHLELMPLIRNPLSAAINAVEMGE